MNIYNPARQYDLVLCDIDGCLCSETPAPMQADLLAKLAEYNHLASTQHDRPHVTVCTGRPQPFAEAMCRMIHNDRIPCIAENGVWIYQPADNSYFIDPTITDEHYQAVYEASDYIRHTFIPQGYDIQPGKTASISIYHHDRQKLKDICPDIEAKCLENNWPFRVSMTWTYINCDLTHISKATGINRLLAMVECDPARLAGIGDTQSDQAIAQAVDYFACPANAHRDILPHANYVSPHAEIEGVLDILGKLAR